MKIQTLTGLLFCIAILTENTIAGTWKDSKPAVGFEPNSRMPSDLRFLENKGQMADLKNKPVKDLLFKTSGSGVDMYITSWGLSYVFTKTEKHILPTLSNQQKVSRHRIHESEKTSIQYCRADMELVGADIRRENIIREFGNEERTDFYLAHCPEGVMNVHSYGKIKIKNIYPGIDWVLYNAPNKKSLQGNTGGIKYDFIVHPGANPSLIRFQYKWTDKPGVQKDGSLKISTPLGDILEGRPVSYGRNKELKINTRYQIQDKEISFDIEKFDPRDTLIIDPSLVWATYYSGVDAGTDILSMNDDGVHVWVTGYALSTGFPTFNSGGLQYFQGTNNDSATMNGNLFILEFSVCGKLTWATYYGGSGGDWGWSISSDRKNVWVTGYSSSTDFPLQAIGGAYNQNALEFDSTYNVIILEFSCTTNARLWATYYGGSGGDEGYSISSDGKDVWITGFTGSTDFPLKTLAGAYNQAVFGGVYVHAFVLQFSCVTNARIWATYYGGNGEDEGSCINSDGANVWVTGITLSTDFPLQTLAGGYNQSLLASTNLFDAFILKFKCSSGALQWATYFGGSSEDAVSSISSDGKNIWLTGYTNSSDFPIQYVTGAYNQPVFNGGVYNNMIFVSQFDCVGSSLKWSTYYGGSGNDLGYSIQSDGANVWVTGLVSSTDFPTMNSDCGYFQDTIGIGIADVFILQFNTSGARKWATYYGSDGENDGNIISSDGVNLFIAGDAGLGGYPIANPGGGAYIYNPVFGPALGEPCFIAKFNISCTSLLTTSKDTVVCAGNSVQLTANGSNNYAWSPAVSVDSSNGSFVTVNPKSTTTYTVSGISSSNCSLATATVTVNTFPTFTATAIQNNPASCGDDNGTAIVNATGGTGTFNYDWSNGTTGNVNFDLFEGTYYVKVTDNNNCTVIASATISDSLNFFIPNAFSPNGDGENDILYIHPEACIIQIQLQIYDRWGELVFSTLNPEQGWDGKFNGSYENTGVFIYYLRGTLNSGKSFNKKGNITLLR